YLGGSGSDAATILAIAPTTGEVYVAGTTFSGDFPGTVGGAQDTLDGTSDTFVARLNADLTALDQATFLGGRGDDSGIALAIAATGDVYVAALSAPPHFPGPAGGAQSAPGAAVDVDGFVARLNPRLTALEQATYLRGNNLAPALALAIAPTTGDVYVAGLTASPDFPGTRGGAQEAPARAGFFDAFVARLNASLTDIEQATYLGGNGQDEVLALAIAPTTGHVYVAGETDSVDLPGTRGGAQGGPADILNDAFVARLNASLTALDQPTTLCSN